MFYNHSFSREFLRRLKKPRLHVLLTKDINFPVPVNTPGPSSPTLQWDPTFTDDICVTLNRQI